jgi:hypothetical protein
MQEEAAVAALSKREGLPSIPSEEALERKVKSEAKISNKSMVMPSLKPSQLLEKELEKRLNYSSFLKDAVGSKRKIDSLIDHFVRSREFTK